MKIPAWAPPSLVKKREEILVRIARDRGNKPVDLGSLERREALDFMSKYTGPYFPGNEQELAIAERLSSDPGMEVVWKRLERRAKDFKPSSSVGFSLLFFGKEQAENLAGACLGAYSEWINTPKRTRVEQKALLNSIAEKARELAELMLLEVGHEREMLDMRRYLPKDFFKHISEAIDLRDFGGDGSFLEFVMADSGLPTVPEVLLRLHDKAREHAAFPMYVTQPNAADAQLHHFIRAIAKYFTQSYGSPLYENVAAVANAIFGITTTTSDDVRSLLRADKARSQKHAKEAMRRMRAGEELPEERRPIRRIGRKDK